MSDPPPRRRGPIFDDAMKILADNDLDALLSVVGVTGPAELLPSELPGSAMRVDLVVGTPVGVVHVEYVKDRTRHIDLRMMEYRLRLRRRYPDVPLAQYVLVLSDVDVPAAYVDIGTDLWHATWTVVRLDSLTAGTLLASPTTAAVAALASGGLAERAAALTAALELIVTRSDPDRGRRLHRAATALASIVLPPPIIDAALKEADMPVPIRDLPLAREFLEEGERAATLRIVRRMLLRRFGADPRIDDVAAALAVLPEDEWLSRIDAADDLAGLTG